MPGTGATHRHPFDAEHGEEPPVCGGEHRRDNAGHGKGRLSARRWPKGQAVRVGHAEERASRAPKPPADGGPLPVPP